MQRRSSAPRNDRYWEIRDWFSTAAIGRVAAGRLNVAESSKSAFGFKVLLAKNG